MNALPLTPAIAREMLGQRPLKSAKWAFGRLLLVCGSREMPGSAVLCALAAARSGAGLVRLASVEPVCAAAAHSVPEATLAHMPEGSGGEIASTGLAALLLEAEKSTAVVLGCGLGLSSGAREITHAFVRECPAPLVIDADGLNMVAEKPDILLEKRADITLTPHIREFARLARLSPDEIAQSPAAHAAGFAAKYGVTVALKGSDTYIAAPDGRVWLNSLDNTGLARGGSGDALAGLVGGLLAQGLPPEYAAAAGVYIHSQAGDAARRALSEYAMTVRDVISFFPAAFNALLDG